MYNTGIQYIQYLSLMLHTIMCKMLYTLLNIEYNIVMVHIADVRGST
jgi:hypothetical protein